MFKWHFLTVAIILLLGYQVFGQTSQSVGPSSSSSLSSHSSATSSLPPNSGSLPSLSSLLGSSNDLLSLSEGPPDAGKTDQNTIPPYSAMNADATVSPPLGTASLSTLNLDLDRRIKDTESLLNRMVWQLNRETAWANSVHDIIQNYQYKYSKVLQNIKQHGAAAAQLRELVSTLRKARLHEVLEHDLAKATDELTELSATSAETSDDQGSYASLKDRVALMKQDLEKMSNVKVNKVLHNVQEGLKKIAQQAVPPDSADTLKSLIAAGSDTKTS